MKKRIEIVIERMIFSSRWLQLPLYLGLIAGVILFSYKFYVELYHMLIHAEELSEEMVMLGVLTLLDITLVINILIMVIIGGYATFISHLDIGDHNDRPDWLDHITAGTLKVKLAGALVGVSGIHLLKTFINIDNKEIEHVMWQVIIHAVFVVSTLILGYADRILSSAHQDNTH